MFEKIEAKTVGLRLVQSSDAEFIYNLRINDNLNKYLSSIFGGIENQRQWIEKYKEKEYSKEEFYFIIYRKDTHESIGTVRLYDFIKAKNSFCWGSWILNENKTRYAAVESALLVYELAFKKLEFEQSHFEVRKENIKVVDFHRKFGAKQVDDNEIEFFFTYSKNEYIDFSKKYKRFL
ncbi:GNAT family N-acetyltransferase [Photobacterium phosphoreum]|uniref:GNAT family N-acetyltransferase n=1 Tax=Photobacterium phosphoreum TaxID=659 RepID=UPI0024B98E58|nr:GNAT family N-acetyltransferase [Photobacterium phosphoreum]